MRLLCVLCCLCLPVAIARADVDAPPSSDPVAEELSEPILEEEELVKASPRDVSNTLYDLRLPVFTEDGELPTLNRSWLNDVIDDHLLLKRNVYGGVQVIGKGSSGFGMTQLGLKFDIAGAEGPWWLTGYFGWSFLSGPAHPDVPPQVYDLGVEINYARQLDETWGVHFQVSPLFATDFSNKTSDAFRLTAGGLVTLNTDETTKVVAGLMFLDRPDFNFLPVIGTKWRPSEDLNIDLVFPRSRFAWRLDEDADGDEWLYFALEFCGDSWAIEREHSGRNDRMAYRDLRLVFGWETRLINGDRQVLEAGYVFARRLKFDSGPGDQDPGGTFVVRWGRTY